MSGKIFHSTDLSKYSVVVTGGAGFIGSHLTEYLLSHNAKKVFVLDDLSTGSLDNLKPFEQFSNFEFVKGSICDLSICEKVLKQADYVLHQAALCSVPRSIADPGATHQVNVSGFLNVLMAAKNTGIKRLVYASSSSVYGDSQSLPKRETDQVAPLSPYAVSKLSNELYASVFTRNYNLSLVGLRYFNIFGPRQNPNGPYAAAIPLFIMALLEGKSPTIYGDGRQTRDFTFVENVIQANVKALFADDKVNGQVFNIAAGGRTAINELYSILAELAKSNIKPNYQPSRKGDVKDSNASVEKAKEYFGYIPEINFREGIKATWEWYKEHYKIPKKATA